MAASKRIPKEYKDVLAFHTKDIPNVVLPMPVTVEGFYARPKNPSDIFNWEGCILGPEGTPYEGGIFLLEIAFPTNYPFSAPKIKFLTKLYHCNVNAEGYVFFFLFFFVFVSFFSLSFHFLRFSHLFFRFFTLFFSMIY